MPDQQSSQDVLELTATIVARYVAHNTIAVSELPTLIKEIHGALGGVETKEPPVRERPEPAVPIKKSVQDDHIVCLEDGKKLKMLKRHLKTAFNMTPEEYRERWNLPPDYPMVAPSYARQRSSLAKRIGLGTRNRKED